MKIAIIVAVFGLLLAGSLAWAKQGGGFGPENRSERIVEKVSKRLDLDDTQQAKLEHFAQQMTGMREQKREQRKEGRQELMQLLDASTIDRNRAMDLLDARHREFKSHMQELVDAFSDFSDSLNMAQRDELKQILAERMERRHQRKRWAK